MTSTNGDILITGASGRIGGAYARRFARAGYAVHLTARRPAQLADLAAELKSAGATVKTYALQLGNLARCRQVVRDFFRAAKRPVALIGNAGNLGVVERFRSVNFRAWRAGIEENFFAHAAMAQAFAQLFARRRGRHGAIVLMSGAGLGADASFDRISSYSTAKAAITHLVEALAPEMGEVGLTINAIAPGLVLSGMTHQMLAAGARAGTSAAGAKRCISTGGVSPDLAAALAEFLVGPGGRRITGRLLSARFDTDALRRQTQAIARQPSRFRLRRIDQVLFGALPQ